MITKGIPFHHLHGDARYPRDHALLQHSHFEQIPGRAGRGFIKRKALEETFAAITSPVAIAALTTAAGFAS